MISDRAPSSYQPEIVDDDRSLLPFILCYRNIPRELLAEMREWCLVNVAFSPAGEKAYTDSMLDMWGDEIFYGCFLFRHKQDAAMFKLRFWF